MYAGKRILVVDDSKPMTAFVAQAQAFSKGYFDQTAQLWSEAGELLVAAHQVVYYKT